MPGSDFPYLPGAVRGSDTYADLDARRTFADVFAEPSGMDTSIRREPDGGTITRCAGLCCSRSSRVLRRHQR